jgi:hypothetical protein
MQEQAKCFVNWAVAALDLRMTRTGDVYSIDLPEADRAAFVGQASIRFTLGDRPETPHPSKPKLPIDHLVADGPLLDWLCARLRDRIQAGPSRALHARPVRQPQGVHETEEVFNWAAARWKIDLSCGSPGVAATAKMAT